MICCDTCAYEISRILVIGEEASYRCHVAFSERLWQRSFIEDADIVLEISDDKLVFEGSLLHFD